MSNKFVLFFPFFFWWHIILHVNIFCVPFLIFSHSTLLRVFMGFSIIWETVNGNLLAGLNDLQIECGRIYDIRWDFNGRESRRGTRKLINWSFQSRNEEKFNFINPLFHQSKNPRYLKPKSLSYWFKIILKWPISLPIN